MTSSCRRAVSISETRRASSAFALAPVSTSTPSSRKRFATGRVSSASYCGRMRGLRLDHRHLARPSWRRRCRVRARYSRRRPRPVSPAPRVSASASVDEITRRRTAGTAARRPPSRWRSPLVSARMTCRPSSVSTSTVLPSRNVAQPTTILTPAFLSRPATPLFSRPTMPSFHAMVLREVETRFAPRCRAGSCPRAMCETLEFVGRMDQRLGRDAADIEAGAARLLGLDDHGVDAELAGADGADIAARPGADHQKLAGDLFHGISFR